MGLYRPKPRHIHTHTHTYPDTHTQTRTHTHRERYEGTAPVDPEPKRLQPSDVHGYRCPDSSTSKEEKRRSLHSLLLTFCELTFIFTTFYFLQGQSSQLRPISEANRVNIISYVISLIIQPMCQPLSTHTLGLFFLYQSLFD